MLPKTSTYVKIDKIHHGYGKWICFVIENNGFSEKHNTVWDIVRADIKKEFDIDPV